MKNIYLIIIVLLTVILIYFILASKSDRKTFDKIITDTAHSLDIEKKRGLVRDYFLTFGLKYNDTKISEGLILTDEKGIQYKIKEKLTTKMLIFRYSELQCNVCVEKQIEALKKYKTKIGIDNILILADYKNFRNLIIFKRMNSLDIPVYSLSKKMSLELEKTDLPYFFIADSSLIARDHFIPIKEIKNYTENYLKTIHVKHFRRK